MPGQRELLGLLLPAIVCGLLLAAAYRAGERLRAALSGFAFAAGWIVGYVLLTGGLPAWPRPDRVLAARDWLAWVVVLAGLVALLHLTPLAPRALAMVARPALAVAVGLLPLRTWAVRNDSLAFLGLASVTILVLWILSDRWISRTSGIRAPLALFVAAAGASATALLAHSALLAMLIGALAGMLAASAVFAAIFRSFRLPTSASAVVVVGLLGATLIGHVTSTLSLASAILIGASIVLPGLAVLGRAKEETRWRGAVLCAALALAPVALAAWFSWSPDESGY